MRPILPPPSKDFRLSHQRSVPDFLERERYLGFTFSPENDVLVIGNRHDAIPPATGQRVGAHPRLTSDEPPPVLRPAKGPFPSRRRHLQHIPWPDHRPGFEKAFERPADHRTVVGRDSLARAAVRAVHPYLQDWSLKGSRPSEIHELETKRMGASSASADIGGEGKKMWGNSPTSTVGATQRRPNRSKYYSGSSLESMLKAGQRGSGKVGE